MPLPKEQLYTLEDIYKLPEGTRAELIGGRIYGMASPGTLHQRVLSFLHFEIAMHIRSHGGTCEVFPAPFAVFLNREQGKTDYLEPDLCVVCEPEKIDGRGCHGAPDWVIEIVSPGSRRMDYYTKLSLYRAARVREYWIVDPMKPAVVVYEMEYDGPPEIHPFEDSVQSTVLEGLSIDFSSLHTG